MSTIENNIGIFRLGIDTLTTTLNQSGYRTVFDITSESISEFEKNNPEILSSDAKEIYKLAVQRTENLRSLYKSWQLHNDPIVKNIPKLSSTTRVEGMRSALKRNLGDVVNFEDLFPERSPEGYAESTSIQSLFSPGRYLTVLYKIARQLHDTENELHIDNRRPNLQTLILSEDNMNKEVSSLDILLDVLQSDGPSTLKSLKNTYYPMTLPYDDDLMQINAVAESHSTNLSGIWDILIDTQRNLILKEPTLNGIYKIKAEDKKNSVSDGVLPSADITPSPPTRETLSLTPNSFQLLVNSNPTVEDIANHYNVQSTNNLKSADLVFRLNDVNEFCIKTGLSFNKLLELTMQNTGHHINNNGYKSRFLKFGSTENVPVSTYGAVFLTGTEKVPLWVNLQGNTMKLYPEADDFVRDGVYANSNFGWHNDLVVKQDSEHKSTTLNFTEENVVALAGRTEKLVRLAKSTGFSFEQLDWLIVNASKAIFEHDKKIILDKPVLEAIAEFKMLNKRYGITSNVFTAYIGEINTYAEAGKKSFYQNIFSNVDGTPVPLGATLQFAIDKQGVYESICCGAMGVTADEFSRMGIYCFGNETQQITTDEASMAQLYRLGKIPQMLGLSFREAELLWKTMDNGKDTLLRNMGSNPHNLETLDIIRQTEVLLDWMDTHQLDVVSLHSMITDQYSGTATPELYNFLSKVYQSIISITGVSRADASNNLPADKLYRVLATEFNLKTNVMAQVVNWIDKINPDFTSRDFWDELQSYFSTSSEEQLTALEERAQLLRWCQQLGQCVIIVRWSGLNEQELKMMIEHPEQLLDGYNMVSPPSLHLLLVLSRLKEWEQRVKVSTDEALRYFAQVNSKTINPDAVVKLLAHIHGWNETDTTSMNNYLFGDEAYPKNFEQLYTLENWVNLGKQLNIGSRTLGELVMLMRENDVAEHADLITSVAQSLIATVQPKSNLNTKRR
ncbi:Tc toxin subunit A [Bacillus cereus]|uniref:Tc toxin subunit A n=1 Tax=Bacillus cereus TaxID=1396 RepID=UPI002AC129D6|nr:Tc toxin subunit A [Bacillus cereus]MDZ4417297.1 Tc toxin subunit A [Bacillus cereus]